MPGTLREKIVETLQCDGFTPEIVLKETYRMPAKPKHLRAIIASLFSLALLVANGGVILPMRTSVAHATGLAGTSPSDQVFKAHRIEIQPEIRKLDPTRDARSKSAGAGLRPVRYACQNN